MIYACDTCHYLFASEDIPNRCSDCGKPTVRPAHPNEVQEFTDNQHPELVCYVHYESDGRPIPVPQTRITISGSGAERQCITGMDGAFRILSLDPGAYFAEVSEVPVGFVFSGETVKFELLEGTVTSLQFSLAEK